MTRLELGRTKRSHYKRWAFNLKIKHATPASPDLLAEAASLEFPGLTDLSIVL